MPTPLPRGNEFLVNTTTFSSQNRPTITALSDGRFVVAWEDHSQALGDTSSSGIRVRVHNADGSPAGNDFLVKSTAIENREHPTITALSDGRFVVAWSDASQTGGDTSGYAIWARIFNADGSPAGNDFLINSTTFSTQTRPTMTALSDGRFVVAWEDYSQTGGDISSSGIRAWVFNVDGSPAGNDFLINSTTFSTQYRPTITALSDGRFVVAWADASQTGGDNSGYGIRARVFNADGSPAGNELRVNSTTLSNQLDPTITALSDGRFVVA